MSKLYSSLLLWLALAALIFALQNGSGQVEAKRAAKRIKFCKFDMFFQCLLEPLSQFTSQVNGSGIVNSEEEMEQFCFNLHDYFPVCARQWMRRCGSPIQEELMYKLFVEPFRKSMKDFCDPNGPIRPEFLKHANCLIHHVKLSPSYRKKCVRGLQAASEFIQDETVKTGNITYFWNNFCCSYNQWATCMDDHLIENCGADAAEIFPNLIHHGTMFLLKDLCPLSKFDPRNEVQCIPAHFKAPEDYKPKGLESKSLISYLFSVSCPNVGWGIDHKRDF